MADGTVTIPTYSNVVNQAFLIEPLGGVTHPLSYLDRFPDALYDKSLNSNLVKLIYTLIGPAGVASIKDSLLQARLQLEAAGLELFDMERFYGNPFAFGRILEEVQDADLNGLVDPDQLDEIRVKDERYRSRAIDFMLGVKAGNSPQGLTLVARSGLGHNVEIIENYRYLFDRHSDDPLGLPFFGQTTSTEEFIVIPRQEISKTESQRLFFDGSPDGGSFLLGYGGQYTTALAFDAHYLQVQAALQALSTVGIGNAEVRGGIAGLNDFIITFKGALADRDVQTVQVVSALYDLGSSSSTLVNGFVEVIHGGFESINETVNISDRDVHNLQGALDRIRPVATIFSTNTSAGKSSRQRWQSVTASSEYAETRRWVSGDPGVPWPAPQQPYWIEPNIEKAVPRTTNVRGRHYVHYHTPAAIYAYTDVATEDDNYLEDVAVLANYKSEHFGVFSAAQRAVLPILRNYNSDTIFKAEYAAHSRPNPARITDHLDGLPIFNESYPSPYLQYILGRRKRLPFWASLERTSGEEFLEIDLGSAQAVNFLSFDLIRTPLDIEIDYDTLDMSPRRSWAPVYPVDKRYFNTSVVYSTEANPWHNTTFLFQNRKGEIPFTRYLRLRFKRHTTGQPPGPFDDAFLWDKTLQVQNPWSVDIRGLRLGRMANPTDRNGGFGFRYFWWREDLDAFGNPLT